MLPPPFPSLFGLEYGGTNDFYNKPLAGPFTSGDMIQAQAQKKGPPPPPKPKPYKASQVQPGYVKNNFNFSVSPGDPKYYQQIYDWGQGKDNTGSFASPWYDPTSGMGYGDFNPKATKKNPNPQPTLNYSYNAPKPWTPPPPDGTKNTLPGGGSGIPPTVPTKVQSQSTFSAPSPYPTDANSGYDPTQFNQPGAPMPSPTSQRQRTGIGGVPPTSSGYAF